MIGRKIWYCWIDCYEEPLQSLNMEELKDSNVLGEIISQQPVCVLNHLVVPYSVTPWTVAHPPAPTRLLCPRDSPGENTGVGCCALLQVIFSTQGTNPGLPHCRWILYHLNHHKDPGGTEGSSVQFSCSVVSNSLQPHGLQHTRPPCPSPTPGVHSDSRPSSR